MRILERRIAKLEPPPKQGGLRVLRRVCIAPADFETIAQEARELESQGFEVLQIIRTIVDPPHARA